jgi:hypothetical protein
MSLAAIIYIAAAGLVLATIIWRRATGWAQFESDPSDSGCISHVRTVSIDGFEALDRVMTGFHDQRFDLDVMTYEPESHRWVGRFFRRVYDATRTTRERGGKGPMRCYFPVVEATLTLHSVTDCKVLDDQRIVTYMFNQCERTNTGCALVFCEAMSVVLDVPDELTGELREHELDRRGYVEEYGRFTQSGIHLEGEE